MIPGVPPGANNRRQHEYQQYPYPQQPQHPYYAHPQQFLPQHYAPQHNQQWYPPYQQQYPQPPRQYMHHPPPPPPPPQQAPMIVSSHLPSQQFHPQGMAHRPNMPTPPVQPTHTPPQAPPFTPGAASHTRLSPALSAQSPAASTPPPSAVSRVSTATTEAPALQLPQRHQGHRMAPFQLDLPWFSVPGEPFPPRARHKRRVVNYETSIEFPLPLPHAEQEIPDVEASKESGEAAVETAEEAVDPTEETSESQASTLAPASDHDTPATSQAPSEIGSEQPTTPISAAPPRQLPTHTRTATKPVVPVIPKFPKPASPVAKKESTAPPADVKKEDVAVPVAAHSSPSSDTSKSSVTVQPSSENHSNEATPDHGSQTQPDAQPAPLSKPAAPKLWADLVRTKPAAGDVKVASVNGVSKAEAVNGAKATSLADVIRAFSVDAPTKITFFQPRGLVNSGNMCYMNSVLQILAFCTPFYDFLDLVGKRVTHKIKSDTPLLDAMIEFLREFPTIDSAESVEQLRLRLKKEELEQFGDAFTPEYVYDATKALPRFSTMRRGHQQDAEEYLNFLLETLHDECAKIIGNSPDKESTEVKSPTSEQSAHGDAGWQEVGPKQKASVTQSSGNSTLESPVAKIFGGTFRSELRVPGKRNSVTFQPYQPLQLDIGAPEVHNIVDALKGLTRSETIHGDFSSPRGKEVTAHKQIFIETLPPVLILHLKRFQYDNKGGTQKIWKKVGYPLELTIPREVFQPGQRASKEITGYPKYRLTGVIYHHGKNATSGHYTVDVRRQEGREWIRIDDTVIRRLRSEDVASGGAEEDPKVLARALQQHQDASSGKTNIYDQFGEIEGEDADSGGAWNQANGSAGGKKWSAIAGAGAGANGGGVQTPKSETVGTPKEGKDKVAYILFYRRI